MGDDLASVRLQGVGHSCREDGAIPARGRASSESAARKTGQLLPHIVGSNHSRSVINGHPVS
jgi:hypothetical protein